MKWVKNHKLIIACLFALAWVTLFYAAVRYELTEALIRLWVEP